MTANHLSNPAYRVELTRKAAKELKKIRREDRAVFEKIIACLRPLAMTPIWRESRSYRAKKGTGRE